MIIANNSKCGCFIALPPALLDIFLLAVLKLPPYAGPLLARVTDALHPTVGYFELGLNLGMALSDIKVIEHDYQNAYRRLVEVVNWWLKRQKTEESSIWRMIIKCLERMKETELARQISDSIVF